VFNLMNRSLFVAVFAALVGGMLAVAPAHAQTVPPVPGIGSAIGGCVVLAGLSPCLGTVIPASPVVVVPGFGGRNVDIDKDVDRNRTPGRVVVVQ
jgi:hypothetical protein